MPRSWSPAACTARRRRPPSISPRRRRATSRWRPASSPIARGAARNWTTIEEPLKLDEALASAAGAGPAGAGRLPDLVALERHAGRRRRRRGDRRSAARRSTGLAVPVVFVSNEVGLGIVPDTPLGRSFRDAQGRLNMRMAERADRVILMTAGLPLTLKDRPRRAVEHRNSAANRANIALIAAAKGASPASAANPKRSRK